MVSNKDNNKSTGKIYKISKDLDQILSEVSLINSELNLWNDTEYILHFGQATYNKLDQRIYISVMDVGHPYWKLFIGKLWGFINLKPEIYGRRTALISFDLNLKDFRWYDWSTISSYFDAIHFEQGELWFDCGFLGVINFEEFLNNSSDLKVKKFDINRRIISKAQGLKIKNNKLFYVPEYEKSTRRTQEKYIGINQFDISELIERKGLIKVANKPEFVFRFKIPNDNGDHEAMDFIYGSSSMVLIGLDGKTDNGMFFI